jgi:tRNA uridine 5-carbamoylmethylation protein Kti12
MKVVNLFAGPGAGKSTTAAGLFHIMKQEGYKVELITEYAKDIVWADRHKELNDQLYITAKQNHRQFLLKGKVDYAITDSPILLCCVYSRMMPQSFQPFVKDVFHEYDNLAVILKRTKPYILFGRNQTEEEAKDLDRQIHSLVYSCVPPNAIIELNGDSDAPAQLLQWIKERE